MPALPGQGFIVALPFREHHIRRVKGLSGLLRHQFIHSSRDGRPVGEDFRQLIDAYTRESGVRTLERELAAICRKAAGGIAEGNYKSLTVKAD